jgi:hypothetical protein
MAGIKFGNAVKTLKIPGGKVDFNFTSRISAYYLVK